MEQNTPSVPQTLLKALISRHRNLNAQALQYSASVLSASASRNLLIESLSQLPTATHYDLLAAFTFHTYTRDFPEVTHSPELVFDAVPERGKSRTGKAMSYVVMRGLRTETLREANISRWSEDLGATLFFDVLNLWKKAEREYPFRQDYMDRFRACERQAREGNKGLWREERASTTVSPSARGLQSHGEIHGNRKSKIYHLPSCPDYSRLKPDNVVPFASEAEAVQAGYRKAGNCR